MENLSAHVQWRDADMDEPGFLNALNAQLADVAQTEWALHRAAGAADASPDPTSFAQLMQEAHQGLRSRGPPAPP